MSTNERVKITRINLCICYVYNPAYLYPYCIDIFNWIYNKIMPYNILRGACVVVGDATSGKSAMTQVFHSDGSHFPKNYTMTVGVELCTKSVTIPETNDSVELFIYDSAGKEVFFENVQKHWDHPSMLMVVYDVTSETSFNSCAKWLERVQAQSPGVHIPGVLVGNKIDLDQRRVISTRAAEDFAQSNGLTHFECSAKEMENVDQPFQHLAKQYYRVYQEKLGSNPSV